MRLASSVIITILLTLTATVPEMATEKARERELCVCTENNCRGPDCCYNGTC
ncbi:hypothetical protein MYCTH_2299731 [Thermothelomyces thermophilus ATCC 42464]|uniref:Uncharacterized protein n=1 Tax=Thermothelomyces thermophilus (strain ATCC 42464 / BCRC 31852 / DSM 1799) TaxID=573729 RepID=G2Q782_THET4|nr:uncharacterized protein MYCTH_2299731 [Thermothelomyces thermophilus ATCC 42464]AEO55660.1 hypothetical protein MYCTH_2299731 [Thermothelomyces thermophilus ATCC 42464]